MEFYKETLKVWRVEGVRSAHAHTGFLRMDCMEDLSLTQFLCSRARSLASAFSPARSNFAWIRVAAVRLIAYC